MRFLALLSLSVGLVAATSVSLGNSSPVSSSSLERRSVIERRGCTRVSQCHSKLGPNEQHVCKNHACRRVCKKGYNYKKGKCAKKSSGTKKPTKKPTKGNSSPSTGSSLGVAAFLKSRGVSQFHGVNGPGIASWYHTNSGQDSTNWCGFPYDDSVPGIAIDVSLMLNNFGGDWRKAGTAYCGLEVKVTTPSGRSALLYVADGFDPAWIRQKGSIDVIYNSFAKLNGFATSNKNDVVQGVTWEFTGRRNAKYAFGG